MSPAVTDPARLGGALGASTRPTSRASSARAPTRSALVPPDPKRQFVTKQQYKEVFQAGSQADGHGFGFVDAGRGGGLRRRRRLLLVEPEARAPHDLARHGLRGRRDRPLGRRQHRRPAVPVAAAPSSSAPTRRDELVVLFSHHAIPSLTADVPDEAAPPCTGRRLPRPRRQPRLRPRPARLAADPPRRRPRAAAARAPARDRLGRRPLARQQRRAAREPDGQRRLLEHPRRRRGRLAAADPAARALRQRRRHALDLRHDRRPRERRDRARRRARRAGVQRRRARLGRPHDRLQRPPVRGRACGPIPAARAQPKDRNVELLVADPRAGAAGRRALREPAQGDRQARPPARNRGRRPDPRPRRRRPAQRPRRRATASRAAAATTGSRAARAATRSRAAAGATGSPPATASATRSAAAPAATGSRPTARTGSRRAAAVRPCKCPRAAPGTGADSSGRPESGWTCVQPGPGAQPASIAARGLWSASERDPSGETAAQRRSRGPACDCPRRPSRARAPTSKRSPPRRGLTTAPAEAPMDRGQTTRAGSERDRRRLDRARRARRRAPRRRSPGPGSRARSSRTG